MINPTANKLYRDYLNETDPVAQEMLRQAWMREFDSPDEPKALPPELPGQIRAWINTNTRKASGARERTPQQARKLGVSPFRGTAQACAGSSDRASRLIRLLDTVSRATPVPGREPSTPPRQWRRTRVVGGVSGVSQSRVNPPTQLEGVATRRHHLNGQPVRVRRVSRIPVLHTGVR
jgi:hypothetical protein